MTHSAFNNLQRWCNIAKRVLAINAFKPSFRAAEHAGVFNAAKCGLTLTRYVFKE